jgi:hypothetical protein
VPLTEFQRFVLGLLADNRSPDSYLAGGAALHFAPNSRRFSNDLDFFHDSEARVASAFAADADLAREGVTPNFGSPGGVLPLPSGVPLAPRQS